MNIPVGIYSLRNLRYVWQLNERLRRSLSKVGAYMVASRHAVGRTD